MNDEEKYKEQQHPAKTGTKSFSKSHQVMKFGFLIHKRNIGEIEHDLQEASGSNLNRAEMATAVGNALAGI
jgi:hypothetical protein